MSNESSKTDENSKDDGVLTHIKAEFGQRYAANPEVLHVHGEMRELLQSVFIDGVIRGLTLSEELMAESMHVQPRID